VSRDHFEPALELEVDAVVCHEHDAGARPEGELFLAAP
jgi:hypothetical protein